MNVMTLVKVCRQCFQMMREDGWSCFYEQVSSFCDKHEIDVPDIDFVFKSRGRSHRKTQEKFTSLSRGNVLFSH